MEAPTSVVVAITGASGAALGLRIAERLAALGGIAVHGVVTKAGRRTLAHEVGPDALSAFERLVAVSHDINDIGASIASGSFKTRGMIVAPCSIRSLSAIACGIASDLVVRAADVHLKERRKLILMVRETPLHLGHLRSMLAVTEMGAIVMPPVPAFYQLPITTADIVEELTARAIDQLHLTKVAMTRPWASEHATR